VTDKVLESLGIDPDSVNFTVSFVTDEQMRELNKTWRNKDKSTDVLSFPMLDIVQGQKPTRELFPLEYNPKTRKVELGDIVINENEENKEFLIEHGLMHLLGYHHDDHEEEDEE
jgi:probable rRNA maturation factor